jgi:electron transport complex protein RnfB
MSTLAAGAGLLLVLALGRWLLLLQARRYAHAVGADALAERIEALLPQTQCTQCGYSGCKPYAQAIARGEAGIDQCPPGGEAGVRALAELLGRMPGPVNPAHGVEKPPQLAYIREAECIGCTKCIQACPVDAIVGASKLMHTVIAELCTGCELCLPPCPVDCIDLVAVTAAGRDSLSTAAG